MHEAGVPTSVVISFVGHNSADVHRHYVSPGDESLRRAAAALPDVA
jgi:hypothetical protein